MSSIAFALVLLAQLCGHNGGGPFEYRLAVVIDGVPGVARSCCSFQYAHELLQNASLTILTVFCDCRVVWSTVWRGGDADEVASNSVCESRLRLELGWGATAQPRARAMTLAFIHIIAGLGFMNTCRAGWFGISIKTSRTCSVL
jgi:hypothetical protein